MLEILLVIAAIAILAGIVIFAINPGRQMSQARNTQRRSDVNEILNAIYQYDIDNGQFPAGITTKTASTDCPLYLELEICKTPATDCTSLSELITNAKYIVAIPVDPGPYTDTTHSGYAVMMDANSRITVCAPHSEIDQVISVTR